MKKNLSILLIIFSITITCFGQNLPVRHKDLIRDINILSFEDKTIHSSIKPYFFNNIKNIDDSVQYNNNKSSFRLLPLYEAYYWQDINNFKDLHGLAGIGGLFDFSKSNKFGISYQILAFALNTPEYMKENRFNKLIYRNIWFASTFHNNITFEQDFHISYNPYSFLKLELAYSKIFFGDGYRSLLLSDFAPSYPFFKVETNFDIFNYTCVWAVHNTYENSSLKKQLKFTAFHYLDCNIGDVINIAIFESVVSNNKSFFDLEYLNPIIFIRPVEFSLGSQDNVMLGTNLKIKLYKNTALYGQFVIDDIILHQFINDIKHFISKNYSGQYGWFANKWATQIGIKSYNVANINNLDIFTEFNIARPYIYSHVFPEQNYSHDIQPLAHPLGANFVENITGINYRYNRFNINCKFMFARTGIDTLPTTHFGQDIYKRTMDAKTIGYDYCVSSFNNTILQGVKTNIIVSQIDFSYKLFTNRNININAGCWYRNISIDQQKDKNLIMFYLGIKTNVREIEKIF